MATFCLRFGGVNSCSAGAASRILTRGYQKKYHVFKSSLSRQLCLFSSSIEDDEQRRHKAILMDPNGHSARILPGGKYIYKVNKATGEEKKLLIERILGFFWMVKDLRLTNEKPVMPNLSLIPTDMAKLIPPLHNIQTLHNETVALPSYIEHHQQKHGRGGGCTLLVVSFKQFGFDMLPSWIQPFQHQVVVNTNNNNSAKVINLHITLSGGSWLYSWFLKSSIVRKFQSRTSLEDYATTLIHFGPDPEEFRDALRMHNTLTGYALLLDSLGRLRWMSSGKPQTEEELATLIRCAEELCGATTSDYTTTAAAATKNVQQGGIRKRTPHRMTPRP